MGLLDFLFAGAVINSVKKARRNSSQLTHGRDTDYDHGCEEGYDDGCYDHDYHVDYYCHGTYDCDSCVDECENGCDW